MERKKVGIIILVLATLFMSCPNPVETVFRVISFDPNAGVNEMASVPVVDGSDFTIPASKFSKNGHSFLHWNTASNDADTKYNAGDSIESVTADVTLFAIWGANLTIGFNANGTLEAPAEGTMDSTIVGTDGHFTIPANGFTRSGYTFLRWNVSATDDNPETRYQSGDIIVVGNSMTLYAIWTADRVVSFNANSSSGTTGSMTPVTVVNGSSYTIPACSFSSAGCTFLGWNTEAQGTGIDYQPGELINSVESNVTLYARWGIIAANWSIGFNANGGSGEMPPETVVDGKKYIIPANEFTYSGWRFLHWNTKDDDRGQSYVNGDTIPSVTADTTLYAIWTADRIISFDGNGSGDVIGSMLPATVVIGTSYTIPANTFSRAGYTFLRWNTAADGSGTSYAALATIPSVTTDLTLFPVWQKKTMSITFNPVSSSGTGSGTMAGGTVVYGNSYTAPASTFTAPTGYVFSRWNTMASGLGLSYYTGESVPDVSADITLFAIWTLDSRTITFNANLGTGTMPPVTVTYGSDYVVPTSTFTRAGYNFLRWDTTAAGTGESYFAGEEIEGINSSVTLYAIWQVVYRTVIHNANGGTGTMPSATVVNGSAYTVPNNAFTRTGYSFLRWNTNAGGTGTSYVPGASTSPVIADFTLYAIWVANITVTFNANLGTGTMPPVSVTSGSDYIVPTSTFTRAGYNFLRWDTTAAGTGENYFAGEEIEGINSSVTLYAIWQVMYRTVIHNANGGTGTMPSATVANGSAYTVPNNAFTRTGYSFLRWNTNAGGTGTSYVPGASTSPVIADQTLYAIWVANVTVTFNANLGTGTMPSVSVTSGIDYVVPTSTFTRAGYNFLRWDTTAAGTGESYFAGEEIEGINSGVTLYAIWQVVYRTITHSANGGTGTMPSATVANGSAYTVPNNAFTRAGYSFLRWNTSATGSGTSYDPGASTTPVIADFTLYAIWVANVTVTFSNNGGTGTMTPVSVTSGSDYVVPTSTFTRTGYNFLRWDTLATGTGVSYFAGEEIEDINSGVTLYAIWQVVYRTITHSANGGTGTMPSATVANGSAYTVPNNAFTRTGYSFLRWNANAGGTGTSYVPGASISPVIADQTLYAIWVANVTVTFMANNGTGTMPAASVVSGSDYIVPACAFTRTGYNFVRWDTAAAGTGDSYLAGGQIEDVTTNRTLYAIWQAIPVNRTVTFNANGGSGTMSPATVIDGSSYTIPACMFTRTGYTFSHWNTAAGVSYSPGTVITALTANLSLNAIWTQSMHTISFNANGGTGTMSDVTRVYNSTFTVPANSFTRSGYSFNHWNTQADDEGTDYVPTATFPVTGNVTLYAIWQEVTAVVFMTFDGGSTLLEDYFDTISDGSGSVTIVSATGIGGSGNALRRNLGAEHALNLNFTGTNNFWVMYDVYVQSTDSMAAVVHAPLVLINGNTGTRFLGLPLYNGVQALPSTGFNHLRPLTNVLPVTIADKFANAPIEIPAPVTGRWINIKYHVKLDNTNSGLDVYIDKNIALTSISVGDAPELLTFNDLEVTYHDTAMPNTNIYMDNIGIYLTDPDLD